jgi:tetratricopeptide (TPR) repeat protein
MAATIVCTPILAGHSPSAARAQGAQAPAVESLARAAARAIAHGQAAKAESLARARLSSDPAAAAVLARLAIARGRYDEAAAILQPAVGSDPSSEAALELGLLQFRRGRRTEARRTLSPIIADAGTFRTPDEVARAAQAARALGQFRSANALYRDAAGAAPDDPAINTAWGELFLEKYNIADAVKSFRAALDSDAEWAPAHLGMARALADENPPGATAEARRALQIDASLADAHLFLAEMALDDGQHGEARAAIDRALTINPQHLEAHALLGAIAYLEGRVADFDAEVAKTLAINPSYGDAYRTAGNVAAQNYRFDEAVTLVGNAIELDPENTRAYADLGLHLLRTGDEREARRVLERAFRSDPYDVVTYNLLQLLDTLDKFESFKVGDAVVKLDPAEAPVMREYALPIVQEALAKFSARYQFKPRGPIIVEIFPKHDDFAVRTTGLPGMLGALGACFGRVVTTDSPRARPPGSFNWQATLWHELAHVFTIQMSNQRVPRWLTEGVSVWEEGRVRPEWARDSELAFAHVYDRGQALKLKDLNAGFTRPDTIALAYFQASLVVDLIVEKYGEPALHALLRSYGEGLTTDAAVQKALGASLDDLQAAFDARLVQRYAALGQALRVPENVDIGNVRDPAGLQELAARHRDSYPLQLAVGQALAKAGQREAALAAFERAVELVPTATGQDSPHALMAALAEKAGDTARARRELRALLAYDHTNVEAARKLASLADAANDDSLRRLAYEQTVLLDPFDASAHGALGRLALRRELPIALREFQAALAAGPVDVVSAHCDLGEALLAAGRWADAKREALAALEIAPTFERAQELLLRAVERQP